MPNSEWSTKEDLIKDVDDKGQELKEQTEVREKYAEDLLSLENLLQSAISILDTFIFGGALSKTMGFLEKVIGQRKIEVEKCNDKINESQKELEKKQEALKEGIKQQEDKIEEMEGLQLNFRDLQGEIDNQIQEQKEDLSKSQDSLKKIESLIQAAITVLQAGLGVVGAIGNLFKAINSLF